ncbi:hypothetical protein ZEAMMB73_Zm00001d044644 [Zea mays]|uniref:Protein kinase domain-containing protein n=1 Tax=Zea mays TaxID=4577 RepID=A0A1D6NQ85_MAIZE|nr:hypothetical protein ZEAMMB73_Zm00001d044644 [Zea mays]
MSAAATKVKRRVGKYELGRTIGEGTFAKVRFAKNTETGEPVAVKILDKEKVLRHKMAEQVTFPALKPNMGFGILVQSSVSRFGGTSHFADDDTNYYMVMGSKTKVYIVLEYVTGGELFDTINLKPSYLQPENLLLDSYGNLNVSDFGLSALSQQIKDDGLLHTTCGTPNYVAPEVLEDQGYDGAMADLWSCGVILFVLLAGYLPFEDSNLMTLYKKISNAEYTFPPWTSFPAKRLLTRILDPNPMTKFSHFHDPISSKVDFMYQLTRIEKEANWVILTGLVVAKPTDNKGLWCN